MTNLEIGKLYSLLNQNKRYEYLCGYTAKPYNYNVNYVKVIPGVPFVILEIRAGSNIGERRAFKILYEDKVLHLLVEEEVLEKVGDEKQ